MIDIGNNNLDNELSIEKYNKLYSIIKDEIRKRLQEELIKEGSNGITRLPLSVLQKWQKSEPRISVKD